MRKTIILSLLILAIFVLVPFTNARASSYQVVGLSGKVPDNIITQQSVKFYASLLNDGNKTITIKSLTFTLTYNDTKLLRGVPEEDKYLIKESKAIPSYRTEVAPLTVYTDYIEINMTVGPGYYNISLYFTVEQEYTSNDPTTIKVYSLKNETIKVESQNIAPTVLLYLGIGMLVILAVVVLIIIYGAIKERGWI